MKRKPIIMMILVSMVIILLTAMIINNYRSNPENDAININRRTGMFNAERVRAISNSFKTKSWNDDKESEEKGAEELFSFPQSINKKSDDNPLGDDRTAKVLDDTLAAIMVAGVEEDQTVGSVLAAQLYISVDQFNSYYVKALATDSMKDMALYFPDDTTAIEIYKKASDITVAIKMVNSSR